MNRRILTGCAIAAVAAPLLLTTACHSVRKRGTGPSSGGSSRVTLAVLPAESDAFPKAARAITESLTKASVAGVDERKDSKVSLEVVQLSIECVEPTPTCYRAVGRSLSANRLLFAQIAPAPKKALKVSVTLFDVDAQSPHTAAKVFPNEKAATAGIGDLVSEATR